MPYYVIHAIRSSVKYYILLYLVFIWEGSRHTIKNGPAQVSGD